MKLYDAELSGNCHRVRLLLSLFGKPYEKVTVNMRAGENRTPEYLALNPRGQVPVLTDGDFTVWDSQAILVYLARAYGGEKWLPTDARGMAEVMQWMAVSENEVLYGLARARVMQKFGMPGDIEACREMGRKILDVMNAHLAQPGLARLRTADHRRRRLLPLCRARPGRRCRARSLRQRRPLDRPDQGAARLCRHAGDLTRMPAGAPRAARLGRGRPADVGD